MPREPESTIRAVSLTQPGLMAIVQLRGEDGATKTVEISRDGRQLLVDGEPAAWAHVNVGPFGDWLEFKRA